MQQVSSMACISFFLLLSLGLLAKGRYLPGDTKSGDPDTFVHTSPDTVLDTFQDSYINTLPVSYINLESSLERAKR